MRTWQKISFHKTGQTNDPINVTNSQPVAFQPIMYKFGAWDAKTDENGRFVFATAPPGAQFLSRKVALGGRAWSQSQLANVDVKPGATLVTNIGGDGRSVTGRVHFEDGAPENMTASSGIIATADSGFYDQLKKLKTEAERQAFIQSPEVQKVMAERRSFSVRIEADGTFVGEDILPGTYEFTHQNYRMLTAHSTSYTMFVSKQDLVVPPAKNDEDDSLVDLGVIELKKRTMDIPQGNRQ
jgi:hypothetical protein